MAEKTTKTSKSNTNYKPTEYYSIFMKDPGFLTEDQHNKLKKGETVNLKNINKKQFDYLIINNLIEKGE